MKIEIVTNDKNLMHLLLEKEKAAFDDRIDLNDEITLTYESATESLGVEELLITFAVVVGAKVLASSIRNLIKKWLKKKLNSKNQEDEYIIEVLAVEKDKIVCLVKKLNKE